MENKKVIGINYLPIDENVYRTLIENKVIDMLKFPGVKCDLEEMKKFLLLVKQTGALADIHGIPSMVSRLHVEDCSKNVDFTKLPKIFSETKGNERFSMHIGANLLSTDNVEIWDKILLENIAILKSELGKITGKDVQIGGENQPGSYNYDVRTITPEFISQAWGLLDFGVFDVAHAMLAAKELYNYTNHNDEYLLNKYIDALKFKEKVTTIHISGNNPKKINPREHDAHVLSTKDEIRILYEVLKYFPNANILLSEYAYNGEHGKTADAKQACIESVTLANINDLNQALEKKEFMEKNLKCDISNLDECLRRIK